MRASRPFALLAIAAASACVSPAGPEPSLAPRAAERIDPRVPVRPAAAIAAADPALAARLATLLAEARSGDSAFAAALAAANRLAAPAPGRGSEAWIAAQQAVSAAVAARSPTTRALGDVDAIAATAIAARGGLAAADLHAIVTVAEEIAAIESRQARQLEAIAARLGT